MTTPVPVLPMYPRPATPRPFSSLARRRRAADLLLIVAGVLLLVALVSASPLPALLALPCAGLGGRLSPRWRAYVDLGQVEWL